MNYSNENKGALFMNARKEKETHPDFKGSINVNGVDYWISGWKKATDKGGLISLSIEPKNKPDSATTDFFDLP